MAIYNYCSKCYTTFDLKTKVCPKCQTPSTKNYRVEVMVNGKRVRKVVPNLTLAKQLEAKLKTELIEGDYFDRSENNYTMDEVWEQYEISRTAAHLKSIKKTACYYKKTVKPIFGKHNIRNITAVDIEKFKIKLYGAKTQYNKPYAPKTIKIILDIISVLFNFAKRSLGYTGNNPCENVERPKINNEVMNLLTQDQKANLFSTLDALSNKTTSNLFKLLIYTGMRRGEVLKLEWRDVDFERKFIKLRNPKSGRDENLPISTKAVEILKNQYEISGNNELCLVFPSNKKDGQRYDIAVIWRKIKKDSGIPEKTRVHDLRHNFASELAASGHSLYIIQKALRHSDSKTTQRYAHLIDDVLRDAIETIK